MNGPVWLPHCRTFNTHVTQSFISQTGECHPHKYTAVTRGPGALDPRNSCVVGGILVSVFIDGVAELWRPRELGPAVEWMTAHEPPPPPSLHWRPSQRDINPHRIVNVCGFREVEHRLTSSSMLASMNVYIHRCLFAAMLG